MEKAIIGLGKDNVQVVNMTTEEVAEMETMKQQEQTRQAEIETAKAQKDADALAGNNKLLGLGLSQAEATALTGYTPPVSE